MAGRQINIAVFGGLEISDAAAAALAAFTALVRHMPYGAQP